LQEEYYDAQKIYLLDELVTEFKKPGYEIVKHRANFKHKLSGTKELYEHNQQLEDLKPQEVFVKLIDNHAYEEETKQEILSAFNELLEEAQQKENLL
jgi:DNA repair protein SbcD/Mre11